MIELEDERKSQLEEVFAKYAISSLDDAKEICKSKNIDVEAVVNEVSEKASEVAKVAFIVGTAIAIKKDTKLASYVAYDLGEGIQTMCMPETAAFENDAGNGIGNQASLKIKETSDDEDLMINYAEMLDFMGLNKDEMISIIEKLSSLVEEAMKD